MYDLIFLIIVGDPNFENLLALKQARKRFSQTLQQRIHVLR
jgi:hypothetical protein